MLVSTRTRFGAFNTGTLKVKGIYQTGNFFIQNQLLSHFGFLQNLDLAEADAASTLYLYLPNTAGLGEKRERLVQALNLAGFEARKPKDENSALAAVTAASPRYEVDSRGVDRVELTLSTIDEVVGIVRSVLAAVNAIGALIAAIMLFIIAVSIFINLRMTINERLREIGTMRTIGVEARGVTGLFVLENVLLALLFTLGGAAPGPAGGAGGAHGRAPAPGGEPGAVPEPRPPGPGSPVRGPPADRGGDHRLHGAVLLLPRPPRRPHPPGGRADPGVLRSERKGNEKIRL